MTTGRRWLRAGWLAPQCVGALMAATLKIRRTPRERLVRELGTPAPGTPRPRDVPPPPIPDPHDLAEYREGMRVGKMVERCARVLPWRPLCLPQSLATRSLLRRRRIPCVLHLGVADARDMDAHAWVTVHEWSVVGRRPGKYVRVASFSD